MKIRLIIPISFLAAAILISMLAISGCGNLDIKGTAPTNSAPWVKWAITPSDSMVHSFNPSLRWFGGDQDGLINDYMYGVFQAAYLDSASRETLLDIPDTLTWVSLGNVTRATIPLVASPDSSVSVGQYVVLRAIDDQGNLSNVINRYLMRTNNRPTCIVTVPDQPEWVLPDTTATWNGIHITWEGGDSLDYTGPQPDFIWEVKLYGPYANQPDTADFDPDTAPFYLMLTDNDDDSTRIETTGYSFTDLRTGYYIIYVRNFDDANVPSIPALGIFDVYEPEWIPHPEDAMDILLLNKTFFGTLKGNLEPVWRDSVQVFYQNVLADAGIAPDKWTWVNAVPDIRTLYLYRLVIIDDQDWFQDIDQTTQEAFVDYLDVGGMMWVIGRMSFSNTPGFTGLYDYQANAVEPLPFPFLGLDQAYFPSISWPAEFIGANKYDNVTESFPDISIDILKVQALYFDTTSYVYDALPQVERLILAPGTQSIYKFQAINSNASGTFHDFPVAVRRQTATLKTSYFAFPLFMMEYDEAAQVVDIMLDWFLTE